MMAALDCGDVFLQSGQKNVARVDGKMELNTRRGGKKNGEKDSGWGEGSLSEL